MMMVLLFAFGLTTLGRHCCFLYFIGGIARVYDAHLPKAWRPQRDCCLFYVLLPLQYYFVLTNWYGMFAVLIPVYAF